MGSAFRALRAENRELRTAHFVAAVRARRVANKRLFWRLIAGAFGVGMIAGGSAVAILMRMLR